MRTIAPRGLALAGLLATTVTTASAQARTERPRHVSLNPLAPFALSFYGDAEVRTAELQSVGLGLGYLNGSDDFAVLSVDAKYRFWLGDRMWDGWSITPLVGVTRGTSDECGDFRGGCTGTPADEGTRNETRLGFGLQVDRSHLVSRGRMTVSYGVGVKRFVNERTQRIVPDFLPTARLAVGVVF
ncbi:MAG: hypothetical protein MUF21_11815 [Gemmatimonadaceae bacterium]|nr:hypothetical protein [Gemmatimonadaceae bacterium]